MSSRLAIAVGIWLCAAATNARGDDSFLQESPGKLTKSHAGLEGQGNCLSCHTSGGKLANDKCLGCHTEQRSKIAKGRGLHSSAKIKGRSCWTCHHEHRGRSHDVMGWATLGDKSGFDHERLTEFRLRGKHKVTDCNRCHKRRNKAGVRVYLGESRNCLTCHKSDQPHKLDASSKLSCDRCHSEVSWSGPSLGRFSHNRDTRFALQGRHEDVNCDKCHPRDVFNRGSKAGDCSFCHKSPHTGHLFGKKKCQLCHSPKLNTMKKFKFDHSRRTRFKLEGAHKRTRCYSCHKPKRTRKPDRSCANCHAGDSKHGKRFSEFGDPPDCQRCHPGSSRWKPAVFDHDKNTKFELTGKHARVKCRKCHRGKRPDKFERFDPKKVGCRGCHQHKKAHDGKFKDAECLTCHEQPGSIRPTPKARNKFHGEGSKFPLTLAHERVECERCHKQDKWTGVSSQCGPACHADTLHRGSLGKNCRRCHTAGIWDVEKKFDHDKQSKFALKGLHKQTKCAESHPKQQNKPRPTNCVGCHQTDDAHRGKLGDRCEKCHKETGDVTFDHNRQSKFPLRDKHRDVDCSSCHTSIEFKPRPKNCSSCHPEPKVHKGRFGKSCETCHSTRGWEEIAALHDVGNFALEGAHNRIDCDRCHKNRPQLAGTGNLCLTCHKEDDIHGNSLGPRCGECHTQWSFAPARFDHLTVGCDLQGQHRTLPCFDCHKSGNFGGLTSTCFGCHRDDVVGDGIHNGATFFNCGDCHNLNFWERPNDAPALTNSVCR